MATIQMVDGKTYNVLHSFGPNRVIIDYGVPVFADRAADGTWDLGGPASQGEEMDVLKSLDAPMNDKTIVTVTPPDDQS